MKTKDGFDIQLAYLAFVPPFPKGKDAVPADLKIENIKSENKTTDYLFRIFDEANTSAKIEIMFKSNGAQHNPVRQVILDIAKNTDGSECEHAHALCKRLHQCTDERSGNGLFAIIIGRKDEHVKAVLMRFKGDEGLVGRRESGSLVDHMSDVFSKRSTHYKLAVYQGPLTDGAFWKGFSVDKQISGASYKPISLFWIERFLDSATAMTSSQGTMQFSKIIKDVLLKAAGIAEQEQIISGIVNLKNRKGASISLAEFCTTYHLSSELTQKVRNSTSEAFFNTVFPVDEDLYQKEFGKTTLSMEDGIMAFVPTFSYEKHVKEQRNDDGSRTVIISAKLTSKKIKSQAIQS